MICRLCERTCPLKPDLLTWQRKVPRQNFQAGIFERETGRLCGCAGLRKAGRHVGTAALGFELTPDDWGRCGLAIEVASALVKHGFHDLDLHLIVGSTASGNTRVERLARWFGASSPPVGPGRNGR